jgi:hypothetical protein
MIPQKCEKIGRFASPRAATRPVLASPWMRGLSFDSQKFFISSFHFRYLVAMSLSMRDGAEIFRALPRARAAR